MSHGPVILATASHDHMIAFWEPQTGRCYRTIFYPDLHVNRLEITPDKRFLAAACNPHIRLFDINSNEPHKPVMTYESHTNNVMAIGFQNDGNMMYSGSEDGTIKIWDTRAPDCQKEYENLDSQKEDESVVKEDERVVRDSQKEDESVVKEDERVVRDSQKEDESVVRDSQKEDDQSVVRDVPRKKMFKSVVRDVPKKKMYRSMGCQKEYGNVSPVNTVVLHPNQNELISGDQNGTIRVWDLRADACTCELVPEFDTPLRSLSVMWDGTMVVAANDRGTCYIWRALPGTQMRTEYQPLHKLQAHNKRVLKCLLSPENKYLATTSSDKTVKIWNVDGFKLEKVLTGHERWVWDCDFSVDGDFLLTASSDTTARLWSMREGKELKLFQGHRKAAVCCVLRD